MYGPNGGRTAAAKLTTRLPGFTVSHGGSGGGLEIVNIQRTDVIGWAWDDAFYLLPNVDGYLDAENKPLKTVPRPLTSNGYPETDAELDAHAAAIRELFS